MLKHKHHIIPKHAGGTDHPDNLVLLTPEEHAEAHKVLWETHGRWQDYIAWQGLSKRMSNEEIIREKARLANTGRAPWHKGKKTIPRSEETKKKISETMKKRGHRPSNEAIKKGSEKRIAALKNKVYTVEEKKKKSEILKEYYKNNPKSFAPRSEQAKLKTSLSLKKPIMFKGIRYESLKDCKEITGLSRHFIVNDVTYKKI